MFGIKYVKRVGRMNAEEPRLVTNEANWNRNKRNAGGRRLTTGTMTVKLLVMMKIPDFY